MISGKRFLSFVTVISSVCVSLVLGAAAQAETLSVPSETQMRILAQGVPPFALKRLLRFRTENMGKTFSQETYTCPKAKPGSLAYCEERVRIMTESNVTVVPHDYAVIIDFTKSSLENRYFLINFKTGDVKRFKVTHGRESGGLYAYKFSNIHDSKQSSLGIFLTGGTYVSNNHGTVIRMYGLEGSNDLAYYRDIVMHAADYASEDFPNRMNFSTNKPYGRLGVSWGCPAMADENFVVALDVLKHGALVYHYQPELEQEAMSGNEVRGIDRTPRLAPVPRLRPANL